MLKRLFQYSKNKSVDKFWENKLLPLWYKDFPIVISFSAKSGCTTILKWFLEQNGLLQDAYKFNSWVHEYREKVLCSTHDYKKTCKDIYTENSENKYIIKVIRDPFKRAVSSFLHYLRWKDISNNWPGAQDIELWKNSSGLSKQNGLSFKQYLSFVINQNINTKKLDPHFDMQFDKTQDQRVNEYIQIENIALKIEKLEKTFSLKKTNIEILSMSAHNNQKSISHSWPICASSHVADSDFKQKLGTPPLEIFLDEETELLIRQAYCKDINKYSQYYNYKDSNHLNRRCTKKSLE